jgi:hypothetical protein
LPSTTEVARRFVEEDRWMNTKVCAVVVGAALAAAPVAAPAVALLPLQQLLPLYTVLESKGGEEEEASV